MAHTTAPTDKALRSRLAKLNEQVREQASLARALQGGEVDAVVVQNRKGPQLYRIHSDEPLYRTMIEDMALGVATVLVDGTVVYANRHLLTMVGESTATFVGSSLLRCIAEADQPRFTAMMRSALESPQELEVSFRWKSAEGPVLVSARRLPISDADTIGLALVDLRDQTARRAAEESSKAKDELLAAVSHELRTPLTSMMGWLQMLEMEFGDDTRAANALRNLKLAVAAEARIVDDLLDLSRSERGSLPLSLEQFDVREAVETAVNYVTLQAESKSVSLNVQLPDEPLPVRGDASRLRQVFLNLLTNALKFTDARGAVKVRVMRHDAHVEISVSDSGIGISQDFLPFVFEPFQRSDGAQKYQGLGIGLAIAKRLAEAHGGSITAASDGVGRGATFTVRLPLNQ
jgi:PAS domain S-box-containing protein